MDKATFKEAIGLLHYHMTLTAARPQKDQAKKAIEGTLKDNAELYELLAKYDERARANAE